MHAIIIHSVSQSFCVIDLGPSTKAGARRCRSRAPAKYRGADVGVSLMRVARYHNSIESTKSVTHCERGALASKKSPVARRNQRWPGQSNPATLLGKSHGQEHLPLQEEKVAV